MSSPPLGELGWQGISHDDPEVAALREELKASAGRQGLALSLEDQGTD